MRNEAYTITRGFMLGRYPNKNYQWNVEMTTKRDTKVQYSKNKYTLFILDKGDIVEQSDEIEGYTKNSIDEHDMKEFFSTLRPV